MLAAAQVPNRELGSPKRPQRTHWRTLNKILNIGGGQRADGINRGRFVRWNAGLEQVGNAMAVMIRIIATTIGNSGMLRGAGFWRVHD